MLFYMQKKLFIFDKKVVLGKTLNMNICSKVGGHFEESPGEIPHIGWKIRGVLRDRHHSPSNTSQYCLLSYALRIERVPDQSDYITTKYFVCVKRSRFHLRRYVQLKNVLHPNQIVIVHMNQRTDKVMDH